jgi:pimeloyl-ACP methyl ester carboxylesterase
MFYQFPTIEIDTGETTIFVRSSGSGPPLLLLHGFPETHLMWRDIAPLLGQHFTVVALIFPDMATVAARRQLLIMPYIQSARWPNKWFP